MKRKLLCTVAIVTFSGFSAMATVTLPNCSYFCGCASTSSGGQPCTKPPLPALPAGASCTPNSPSYCPATTNGPCTADPKKIGQCTDDNKNTAYCGKSNGSIPAYCSTKTPPSCK